MRVLLDTTYAQRGPSGTGVYIEQLTAALRDAGVEVVEAANDQRPAPAGGGLGSARNFALDARWMQVELPRRAREVDADVLHHPLPALAVRAPCAQVVTVHDLAFERLPELFAPAFRRYASLTHRRAARGADAVVCVSQTTRRDALARWGVDDAKVVVAPHGPGQQPRLVAAVRAEHFLYVGDDEPRKNLGLLLDAYARYRAAGTRADPALPLVLAGRATATGEGVRCERTPDLAKLLNGAAALVHPALHEGFGLTVLEAMSVGVPVLAARSPGLVETVGQAALLFDPYDAGELANALEHVATQPALRADLARRGRERAAAFSWPASAQAHMQAYTLATWPVA
ncbi:MAG TPA: glycosyltransferase family 1 protein [Solirubrobacteraceae bacterium]|nr:glycosyltransferase family 1 protein [Solirubrobacteraceae bacterium]